jgi:NAD(P)-dependent dehydrogenase (short-subunit alcohol dehydrogenase family)
MELKDKVALVTGSARRIGREIALSLASRGCRLALHYRQSASDARHVRRLVRERDVAAEIFQADLSINTQIDELVHQIQNRFGRIDILINNASLFHKTPWEKIQESDWDGMMNINLKAPFLLSHQVSRIMMENGGGKIIHMADVGGLNPWSDYLPYCVAKAGLIALTKGMAKALAPGIQVNAIAPATVLPPENSTHEEIHQLVRKIPLQRIGEPADVVSTVLYLLEGTDYVTGQVLVVDGGRTLV